jgi:hypothetical protein
VPKFAPLPGSSFDITAFFTLSPLQYLLVCLLPSVGSVCKHHVLEAGCHAVAAVGEQSILTLTLAQLSLPSGCFCTMLCSTWTPLGSVGGKEVANGSFVLRCGRIAKIL